VGPGWWLMWGVAEIAGFGLVLLRSIPSLTPVSIIFQDPIILIGPIFIYIGIVRFFTERVSMKFVVSFFVSFVLLHLFFFIVKDDFLVRTLIFDIYQAVIMFLTALSIYSSQAQDWGCCFVKSLSKNMAVKYGLKVKKALAVFSISRSGNNKMLPGYR
jgi:hypothetical protein